MVADKIKMEIKMNDDILSRALKNLVVGFFCVIFWLGCFYRQREDVGEGTAPSGSTFPTNAKPAINTFKFQPFAVANDSKYLCLNNSHVSFSFEKPSTFQNANAGGALQRCEPEAQPNDCKQM